MHIDGLTDLIGVNYLYVIDPYKCDCLIISLILKILDLVFGLGVIHLFICGLKVHSLTSSLRAYFLLIICFICFYSKNCSYLSWNIYCFSNGDLFLYSLSIGDILWTLCGCNWKYDELSLIFCNKFEFISESIFFRKVISFNLLFI